MRAYQHQLGNDAWLARGSVAPIHAGDGRRSCITASEMQNRESFRVSWDDGEGPACDHTANEGIRRTAHAPIKGLEYFPDLEVGTAGLLAGVFQIYLPGVIPTVGSAGAGDDI